MADNLRVLANKKAIENGVDIKSLQEHPGFQLILELLKTAKEDAINLFLDTDPIDTKTIQLLHYRAWRYDELLGLLNSIFIEAQEAEHELLNELE